MSEPLIDIIVPVFNGAQYIPGFLAQFDAQDGIDDDVRIIFVDDGSEDNTGELLRNGTLKCRYQVRIISCQHLGVSAARTAGIRESGAEYIAFFDVDDVCSPDYVSTLKEISARGVSDVFLFCRKMLFDDKGVIASAGEEGPLPVMRTGRQDLLNEILTDETRFGGIHCILMRRSFVECNGLLFAEGYPYYEDTEYLYRVLAMASEEIYVTDRYLYGYIARHTGSAMARFTRDRIRCLSLLSGLEPLFESRVPGFAPKYKQYGVSRIYWSVLWQAALSAPSYGEFRKFASDTGADDKMRMLSGFPDRKVRLLRRLYLISRRVYYMTVRILGRRYSKVRWEMQSTV